MGSLFQNLEVTWATRVLYIDVNNVMLFVHHELQSTLAPRHQAARWHDAHHCRFGRFGSWPFSQPLAEPPLYSWNYSCHDSTCLQVLSLNVFDLGRRCAGTIVLILDPQVAISMFARKATKREILWKSTEQFMSEMIMIIWCPGTPIFRTTCDIQYAVSLCQCTRASPMQGEVGVANSVARSPKTDFQISCLQGKDSVCVFWCF